jgi:5-hydroxyisourate hydrolase
LGRVFLVGALVGALARWANDGQIDHPVVRGDGVHIGTHEVLLYAGDFYRGRGTLRADAQPFLDVIAFRFNVADLVEHYHLPFKISPFGLSVWRGR